MLSLLPWTDQARMQRLWPEVCALDSSRWLLPHLAQQSDLFEKTVDFYIATNCCVFQTVAQARPGDQAWGYPLLLKAQG